MAKPFIIPKRSDRFLPHVSAGGISNPAPLIVRDGEGVVFGDTGANPLVLSRPDGDCCCNDEIVGCAFCRHKQRLLTDSAYFECERGSWRFDDLHTCEQPNDQTICCGVFLPTPFANAQLQTSLGDFYFPNACFSMRISLDSDRGFPPDAILVRCCIGVQGIRFFEAERKAETMVIRIDAFGLFLESFRPIPCIGIRNNKDDALGGGFELHTTIAQWKDVTKVSINNILTCFGHDPIGRACTVFPQDGTLIAEVNETIFLGRLPFKPPFTFLWQQFFDSRDWAPSTLTTQFQIEPEATIGTGSEHDNEAC